MFHPDVSYQLAKMEHQSRIYFAEQSRLAREARSADRRNWFAAIANRFHATSASSDGLKVLDGGGRVSPANTVGARPLDLAA
jgi:hypothetical protein